MTVKLVEKHDEGYDEIFQSVDVKFTMVTQNGDTYTQITTPFKCRDFLGDMLWSKQFKRECSIYGFSYDWNSHPYDEETLKLSITFPDKETKDNFLTNQDFLHTIEQASGTSKSDLYNTDNPLALVIVADKVWMSAIWKLSLLTYYLKVCCYEDVTQLSDPEYEYAEELEGKEEILLQHVKDDFTFYYTHIGASHNYSGFVSIIRNYYEDNKWSEKIFGKGE